MSSGVRPRLHLAQHAAEPRLLPAYRARRQGGDQGPAARLRAGAGDDGTDVLLAERLVREGTAVADPVRGAATCGRRWPVARATAGRRIGLPWLEEQAERLELLRVQVTRALSEARLAAGEHRELVPELEQMAADRLLDEQIQGQLMLALYRSGRQADALPPTSGCGARSPRSWASIPARPSASWRSPFCGRIRPWMAGAGGPAPPAAPAAPVPAQLPPRCPPSPGATPSWPASTRCCPARPARPADAPPQSSR